MKRYFLFLIIIASAFLSCKKADLLTQTDISQGISKNLNGTWRMIEIKDNYSGEVKTKPVSINGDVEITFHLINETKGDYDGNTPTNIISPSDFEIGETQSLTVFNLSITKAWETSWGAGFVNYFRSSKKYDINDSNELVVTTTDNTLIFEKL